MFYRGCSFDRALIFIRSNKNITIFMRSRTSFFFFILPPIVLQLNVYRVTWMSAKREKCHCCSQRPRIALRFARNPTPPHFSPPNSRLISLDPLELSKFSTLTPLLPHHAVLCNQFWIVSHELYSRRYCGAILDSLISFRD